LAPTVDRFGVVLGLFEKFPGDFDKYSRIVNQRKINTGFNQFAKMLRIFGGEEIDFDSGILECHPPIL
jgi:hypothetical protein